MRSLSSEIRGRVRSLLIALSVSVLFCLFCSPAFSAPTNYQLEGMRAQPVPAACPPELIDCAGGCAENFRDLCGLCVPNGSPNPDSDGDGLGDACDICADGDDTIDTDFDEVPEACDNCPGLPNINQLDQDGDNFGDACDNCPKESNVNQLDSEIDGIGDVCEF